MKSVLIGMMTLLLGCETTPPTPPENVAAEMEAGLRGLVGQPIQQIVLRYGYPTQQLNFQGIPLYVWAYSANAAVPVPSTSVTTGGAGGQPMWMVTTDTAIVQMKFSCKVQLATDERGLVMSYQWQGNGCASYAHALLAR
jgi:hypothetical protein